ncbi:MAG: hypothetical protein CVU59_07560 [Deltaproteobacteria bacterium HGW-Deltaproteobacteria-17]|nr:MAG: hypothetical protein CVU59_07560 [Deltaproteobacteria bacterium HGW-Deltaproteobacteria-17]
MKRFSLLTCCVVLSMLLGPVSGAVASAPGDDDEPVMMDDEDEPGSGDPAEGGETGDATAVAVPQRVEQISDGGGLMRSTDEYDTDRFQSRLVKTTPKIQIEGVFGPGIGIGDLASHVGPQIQVTGLYRPWRYFAVGGSFLGSMLFNGGVVYSGYAPALDLHVLIPLPRKDDLSPAKSWEIGLFTRAGYVSQGVLIDTLKQRAEGLYLSAGATLYYWYSDSMRVFGRVEVSFPQWTALCEESSAMRRCTSSPDFSGQAVILTGGISFVIW